MDTTALITAAYDVAFNRPPDAAGLAHHLDLLESGALTVDTFFDALAASAEFEAMHETFFSLSLIGRLYENGLQRTPGFEEINNGFGPLWLDGQMDTGDVMEAIAFSTEYAALIGSGAPLYEG